LFADDERWIRVESVITDALVCVYNFIFISIFIERERRKIYSCIIILS